MMAMSPENTALSFVSDMVAAWAKLERVGHGKVCPMVNVAPCLGRGTRFISCIVACKRAKYGSWPIRVSLTQWILSLPMFLLTPW